MKNIEKVTLNVRKSNIIAQKLYKKFNFTKTKIVRRYYNNGEDAYLMTKLNSLSI